MAEVNFFMSGDDTEEFVRFLTDSFGATFTLDGHTSAELPVFDSIEDINHAIHSDRYGPRFFVLSPKWHRYPLSVHETLHTDGRRRFYVDQRCGGPAFDFNTSRQDTSPDRIYPGWFSDYPWYYIRSEHPQTFDRPEAMALAYREVQKYLRRNGRRSRCRETGRPGPFILQDALDRYRHGCWLRQGESHFEPP